MSASPQPPRERNRRIVALIGALFLLPLAAAFCMYYGVGWRPAPRTNHGELILPARALPVSALAGDAAFTRIWSLVYVGAGCDDSCEHALYVMRQTHLALNNDAERVQRVFIAIGDVRAAGHLARDHPGLAIIDATGAQGENLARRFPTDDRAHAIFIVDPLANLMMRFDSRADPKGLREDLTKLLKLSHVG